MTSIYRTEMYKPRVG